MYRPVSRALMLCLALSALACDDLSLDNDMDRHKDEHDAARADPSPTETGATGATPGASTDSGVAPGTGSGTDATSASRELRVDATDRSPTVWTFVDLDGDAQSKDEAAVPGWDIALQRSTIKLKPSARASVVSDASFESLSQAPSEGWATDTPGTPPTYLLSSGDTGWYDYDGTTHLLTPRPFVYAVQTDAGYQKLQVLGWTNEAGTTADYRLKVGKIAGPKGPTSERDAEVDVSTSASRATDAGTPAP